MADRRRRARTRPATATALALVVLGATMQGCASEEGPTEAALTQAALDLDWDPPIAGGTTSLQSHPSTGDLRIAMVLLNASVDTRLRLGSASVVDDAGIEVVRLGLQPVAEREEPGIAFPSEPLGVVDTLVLPAQHYAVVRAELRPDCDTAEDADLRLTVTDGETRTELRLDDLPSAGGQGWITAALADHCADG